MRLTSSRQRGARVIYAPSPAPVNDLIAPQGQALHKVSQRSVGPCRGKSRPDQRGISPLDRGAPRRRMRAVWQAALRLNDYVEHSWVGDLLGVVSLFALLIFGLFAVEVFR